MKKLFILLLMVLGMQAFNSCTHDTLDDDNKNATEQTDNDCCGDADTDGDGKG